MAEVYLRVTLLEGDLNITLEELIGQHTPELTRDYKVNLSQEILASMVKRVIQRYDGQTWEAAKQRAKEVAKGV